MDLDTASYQYTNQKTRSRDSINGRARIWDMVGGVAGLTEIILNPVNPKIGPML